MKSEHTGNGKNERRKERKNGMNMRITAIASAFAAIALAGCETTPPPSPPPPPPPPNTISVAVFATSGENGMFPVDVAAFLRSELSRRGYSMTEPGQAHADASVSVLASEKAKLDDWFVFEGQADVQLGVHGFAGDRNVERRVVKEGPRCRVRAEAEKAAAKTLGTSVAEWIDTVVTERK